MRFVLAHPQQRRIVLTCTLILICLNIFHISQNIITKSQIKSKVNHLTERWRGPSESDKFSPISITQRFSATKTSSFFLHNNRIEPLLSTSEKPQPIQYDHLHGFEMYNENFPSKTIPLVIVLCNKKTFSSLDDNLDGWQRQAQQIRVMFWSLLLFSRVQLWRLIVLVDTPSTYNLFLKILSKWTEEYKSRLLIEMKVFTLPHHEVMERWRPCSSAKIFLAELMPEFDTVVYSDTDMIFLGPAEDLWLEVDKLQNQIFMAIAAEPWYKYEAENEVRRTMAGKQGLNTGILIMNLTKARNLPVRFSDQIVRELPVVIRPRHDQDIVNSFLSKNNQYFYELSSRFNFLPSVCALNVTCDDCKTKGIVAMHGADGTFYSDIVPRFAVIFAILEEASVSLPSAPFRLLLRLQTQLNLMDVNYQKGSCQHYPNFREMVLYNSQMNRSVTGV